MADPIENPSPQHPASGSDAAHVSNPDDAEKTLDENKKLNTSGLSWDETTAKPNEKWNRATEMGEAD